MARSGGNGRMPGGSGAGREAVLQGLVLLGRFRKEGIARFEASAQAFLASLAPWIAFLLVGAALLALQGRPLEAATDLVVLACFLLVPPVVTQAVARLFRREDRWLRYVTATTWSEWLMAPVYLATLFLLSVAMEAGLPAGDVPWVLGGVLVAYWLALHLFLARFGLDLSPLRAVVLVVAVIAADVVLVAAGRAVGGQAASLFTV